MDSFPEKSKKYWRHFTLFRKEEVLGAAVKNFLILEKSKFHWDKPQNMDSFPEKSKKLWRKFTLSRKEEVLGAAVKNFLILEKSKF